MAFNTLEYLKEGKVFFVSDLTPYDRTSIIKLIRKAEDRNEIIDGFLPLLRDSYFRFCFDIIYDLEDYKEDAQYILNTYSSYMGLSNDQFESILFHTSWGKKYAIEHIEEIVQGDEEVLLFVFKYIFQDIKENANLIQYFYLHKDLHIRFLFMNYIIQNHPHLIDVIYDDFTRYLTSYTYQEWEQISFLPLMDMEDICKLAISVFESPLNRKVWLKLKEYILKNYPENTLASLLLKSKKVYLNEKSWKMKVNEANIEEFSKDADTLFSTSIDYRFSIYQRYSHLLSKEIAENYYKFIKHFTRNNHFDTQIDNIYYHHLGNKLETYVNKYLSLSKNDDVYPLRQGTTSSPYRIGDFVIKLVSSKWSYEDIICPNLFLILENLEEDYVRNQKGHIISGLEVQQYLTESARNVPYHILTSFKEALHELGWRVDDSLIKGKYGDNCMLLHSYKDADCRNPEELPDWFKEYPMVLIDRDLVFHLTNKKPKRLHGDF